MFIKLRMLTCPKAKDYTLNLYTSMDEHNIRQVATRTKSEPYVTSFSNLLVYLNPLVNLDF